jgi:hypothetical protein
MIVTIRLGLGEAAAQRGGIPQTRP